MRERDYAELSAMTGWLSRRHAADSLVVRYSHMESVECVKLPDGTPVGIGGPLWMRPNVATLLFFATDDFRSVAMDLTRYMRRSLIPDIKAQGAHRIECLSLDTYTEMQTWVRTFGLRREGVLRAYGCNGEDFASFAWVKDQNVLEKPAHNG